MNQVFDSFGGKRINKKIFTEHSENVLILIAPSFLLGALEKLIKNVLTNRFHAILCCYHLWTTEHGVETTQICAYFQTFFGSFMIRCYLMHLKCARLAIETHHKLLDIAGAKRNTKKNDNCRLKTNDSVEKISSDLFYVRDFVDRLPYRTFCWPQMKRYAMQHDAHHNVCTWWKISIALVRHSMRMAARARVHQFGGESDKKCAMS